MDVVRLLLDSGASIDAVNSHNNTPLHWASHDGHVDVVRLLLERGADSARAGQEGKTAAQHAETSGHDVIVSLLCDFAALKTNDDVEEAHRRREAEEAKTREEEAQARRAAEEAAKGVEDECVRVEFAVVEHVSECRVPTGAKVGRLENERAAVVARAKTSELIGSRH